MKNPLAIAALLVALTIAAPSRAQGPAEPAPPPHARSHQATHPATRHETIMHSPQGRGTQTSPGDIANQLNRQELSRDQAGNMPSQPPNAPSAGMAPTGMAPTGMAPTGMAPTGMPSAGTPSGSGPASRMPGPKTSAGGYIQPQPGAGTTPPQPSPTGIGATQGGPR